MIRFLALSAWCIVLGGWCGCSRSDVAGSDGFSRAEWPAMSTIAAVQFRGGPVDQDAVAEVRKAFEKVNAEFNAFDPRSVIRRKKKCTRFGRPCWKFAFRLKEKTGGAFDPGWKKDGSLDFGAVAKGFGVDFAATALAARKSSADVLVDLGGNLKAVKGDWTVGIRDGESFVLHEGEACATSAQYFRSGHIKDATTGAAVSNSVYSVTVIHPSSAMIADGLSTVLYILGREKGEEFLKAYYPEVKAVWVDAGL